MSKHRFHGPIETLSFTQTFDRDPWFSRLIRTESVLWCRTCGAWRREVYTAADGKFRSGKWKHPTN